MTRLVFPTVPGGTSLAALAIRAVVGSVLAYHGYQKVDRGVGGFADNVAGLDMFGVGLPRFVGYVVVVLELVGGICLLVGLLTRLWSLLLAVEFLSIPFVVKSDVGLIAPPGSMGTGFELDLLMASSVVALLLAGPGTVALDHVLRLERRPGEHPNGRRPAPSA
jgi:putative oxidoreductase